MNWRLVVFSGMFDVLDWPGSKLVCLCRAASWAIVRVCARRWWVLIIRDLIIVGMNSFSKIFWSKKNMTPNIRIFQLNNYQHLLNDNLCCCCLCWLSVKRSLRGLCLVFLFAIFWILQYMPLCNRTSWWGQHIGPVTELIAFSRVSQYDFSNRLRCADTIVVDNSNDKLHFLWKINRIDCEKKE